MREAGDIEKEDEAQFKAAVLEVLREIRQCVDKQHIFEREDERQRRLVVENAEQPAKVQPPERVAGESKPAPADIIELDPEQLEWEEFTSGRGKQTWRHPFKGQTLQLSPTWKALKAAIVSQPPTPSGRRYYHQGEYFYFLSDDGGIAFRQLRPFKPRKRGGA